MKKNNSNVRNGNIACTYEFCITKADGDVEYGYNRYNGEARVRTGNGRRLKVMAYDMNCGECGSRIFAVVHADKLCLDFGWGSLDDASLDDEDILDWKLSILDKFLRVEPGTSWTMLNDVYDSIQACGYETMRARDWEEYQASLDAEATTY